MSTPNLEELVFAPREDSQLSAATADGTIEMH
jgi:hypothetical protein